MHSGKKRAISLRVRDVAQLFNAMDPSPFTDRALNADAREYIMSRARERAINQELHLVIHVAAVESGNRSVDVETAIRNHFAHQAEMKDREFHQLMRRGRFSLVVGLLFLAACLMSSEILARFGSGTVASLIRESLTIGGWVAMWRPLEIYLYDWWPLRHDWRILQRLARMDVQLVPLATP